jgi:hypothetical protein
MTDRMCRFARTLPVLAALALATGPGGASGAEHVELLKNIRGPVARDRTHGGS